jgi:hypothetical protein
MLGAREYVQNVTANYIAHQEYTHSIVFPIGLMGNGLVQAAHEPADTGKPCPPDVNGVGDSRSFEWLQILAAPVVLNQQRTFEHGAPTIHDLVPGKVS